MALTPAQLTLLRDRHPHFANWYLSVFAVDLDNVSSAGNPGLVYVGTVNGAHNRGARDITCTNVAGNIANVVAGQTVLVGTAAGDGSISKRRLRRRVGQVLTLDGNGVVWTAGDYITVVENYEFWPVFPKIDDTTPYTMYKDDNITYGLATYTDFDATDANRLPSPVALMGPPWAGWITGGSVTVTLVGSESYAVAPGATISSHLWATTGGAIANANIASTTIEFTSCGVYWVTLTVTDSNGKTQRTRRPFFVHDEDTCPPFYDFAGGVNLTHDQGNDMRVSALRDVDFDEIPDQALVVLWADEWFRDANNPVDWTKQSIGGYTGREHIKFVGYLDKESIQADPEDAGALTFDAYSINKIMADTMMWAIALNDVNVVPATWYQYQNINTARAIHHLWRWHSTLLLIADVRLPVDATLPSPGPPDNDTLTCHSLRRFAMDWPENNLIAQARVSAWDQGIYANIGCDKQGVVYAQVDPLMIAEGVLHTDERGVVDEVQDITDEDWYEEIEFIRNERFRTAWTTLSGLNWDGATKAPLIAVMPGEDPGGGGNYDSTPEVSGSVIEEGNKLLDDQADANEKVGLRYARGNNDLAEIRVPEFAGNYSHVDVYPQAFYDVDIPPNKRGLDTADTRRAVPRQVAIGFDAGGGVVNVSAVLEPETIDVVDGVPGKYPIDIPDPTPNAPPEYPDPEGEGRVLFTVGFGDSVFWTPDAGTSWEQREGTRVGIELNSRSGYFDPWGPSHVKKGSYNPEVAILWDLGEGYIYRSDDAGRYWTDVTPTTDPPNTWDDSPAPTPADLIYEQGVADWHTNKQHYVIAYYSRSNAYRGYLLHTDDDGQSWTWYAMGGVAPGIATWSYADSVICEPETCDISGWGGMNITPVDYDDVLGANDGTFGGCVGNTVVGQGGWFSVGIVDLGFWYVLSNATTADIGHGLGGINHRLKTGTITDPRPQFTSLRTWLLTDSGRWTECSCILAGGMYNGISPSPPVSNTQYGVSVHTAGDYARYIPILQNLSSSPFGPFDIGVMMEGIGVFPHAVADEVRPISIALDFESGRYLYITTWEGEAIRLRVYDLSGSGLTAPIRTMHLGDCSRAEFNAKIYWAATRTLYDPTVGSYGLRVLVHGRFNAGNDHVLRSLDGGVTLADIGDSPTWGADWIGAAVWKNWDDIWICRNGGTDQLIETLNGGGAWTNRTALPFEVEFAMTMHGGVGNVIAIGERVSKDVQKLASPYTAAWTDISPAAAAGTRVGAAHWIYNVIP